jgi:hypothetical protein
MSWRRAQLPEKFAKNDVEREQQVVLLAFIGMKFFPIPYRPQEMLKEGKGSSRNPVLVPY